ncbi:MAG: 3'(2'),5'-bisphosphate nucleotidase CysQ [Sphingomonadaceae bacterium]|nr:3'(2'),5'-bisphosphate nucleotidase CysQ [Sphingomonadaceae bacterium]
MADVSLEAVAEVAAEAGVLALELSRGDYEVWEKTPGHKVCDADIAVDKLLRERLSAIDPEAGFLSEESLDDATRLDAPRLWVVDPIDGTRDFIRGRSGWCVSIALVEVGEPVIAALEAPARNERFLAAAGQGATLNGARIRVSDRTDYDGARLPIDEMPKAIRNLVAVEKPNSIALRIAMVASDRADIVASTRWGGEWDIAAAALIAAEAGAKVTDAFGKPFSFNKPEAEAFGLAVAPFGIHAKLLERIREQADKDAARNNR